MRERVTRHRLRVFGLLIVLGLVLPGRHPLAQAPPTVITAAGQPAELVVRAAGERSLRVTLAPVDRLGSLPDNPALADRRYPAAALRDRWLSVRGKPAEGVLAGWYHQWSGR